jgi:hypothetical protein
MTIVRYKKNIATIFTSLMKIMRSYHVRKSFVVEATNSGENKIRASLCLKVSVLMFYIQAKLAIAKKSK